MSEQYTRAKAEAKAKKLAAELARFMKDADQFLSLVRRVDLTCAMMKLEDFADGR